MGYIKRFFVFLCLSLFLSSPFVFFQYYLTDKILPLKIIPYFAFVVSLLLLRRLSLQRQENNFMRIFSWSIFSLASILVFLLGQITFYLKRIYAQTGSFEPVLVFSQNKPLPFFLTWLNFTDTLLAFTISGAFLVLIYIAGSEKIFKRIAIKPLLSYSLFAMLLVPIFFLPFRFELSHIFLKTYVAYQSDRQFFLSFNTDSLVYSNDLGAKKENGEVYVLVIDQNVSRTHMEAFGGGRKTTPWLSSQKENPNWIFFSQGYSSSPNPSIALLNLLSNSEIEKSGSSHSANSLISLFKSANFDVTYIAKDSHFNSLQPYLSSVTKGADSILLSPSISAMPSFFEKTLQSINPNKNNLIIIQLPDQDSFYEELNSGISLPELDSRKAIIGRLRQDKEAVDQLNHYDASILYRDTLLDQLHTQISSKPDQPTAFIYLSASGKTVLPPPNLHPLDLPWESSRIPLAIWLSDTYKSRYPDKTITLKDHSGQSFMSSSTISLLSELADLSFSSKQRSSSYAFSSSSDTQNMSRQFIETDPYWLQENNARQFSGPTGQLAAHRVNTIGMLNEAVHAGILNIEIDVLLQTNPSTGEPELVIGHDAPTRTGITLDEFLSEPAAKKLSWIWFDVKSLNNTENAVLILSLFEKENLRHQIKNRGLIETDQPQSAKYFSSENWKTAYYLDWKKLRSLYDKNNKQELNNYSKSIANLVIENQVSAVSFDTKAYPAVINSLKPLLPKDTEYYAWDQLKSTFSDIYLENQVSPYTEVNKILIELQSDFSI